MFAYNAVPGWILPQTMVNTFQEMVDPHDRAYSSLVQYAEGVCRAVGIKYGMAHVELKAEYNEERKKWVKWVTLAIPLLTNW